MNRFAFCLPMAARCRCWLAALALLPLVASAAALAAEQQIALPGYVDRANQRRYASDIAALAKRYDVPVALVHAVISVESGYNPQAVSSAGAIGLMQLMPATAQDYGVADPFNPKDNLRAGIRHLARLLDKYKNISHALAAYNAGEGAAKRYRRAVPYLETRRYVVKVLNLYHTYKQLYN